MIDTLRGKDSTGVMCAFKDKSVQVVKTADQPFLLYKSQQWIDWRARVIANGRFMMGHNRAATRGTINNNNAHPFVEDNIILMHNGTLHDHSNLTKENVEVDSNAIAHALKEGHPRDVIPTIRGAFALIWYDTQTETLYATRNDQRPLTLIVTEDDYMLTSEPWIAAMPAQRQNRKIQHMREVGEYELLMWNLKGEMSLKQLDKPKVNTHYSPMHGYPGYPSWKDDLECAGDDCSTATKSVVENSDSFMTGEQGTAPKQTQTLNPKHLRTALAEQAKAKQQQNGSTRSNVCALTRHSGQGSTSQSTDNPSTTTTTTDSSGKKNGEGTGMDGHTRMEEERIESAQRSIITINEQYPKGGTELVRIIEWKTMPNGAKKWTGKIMSPDKEMVDAQGLFPSTLTPLQCSKWMESWCEGTVGWVTATSGGLSVFIRDLSPATYVDVHGIDIPQRVWSHASHQCKCKVCSGEVEQWERLHTHVRSKSQIEPGHNVPVNRLTMTCPECLMKVLPDGEIFDKFSNSYYNLKNNIWNARRRAAGVLPETSSDPSVQDREPVGTEPVGKNGSVIVVPGPSTVQ